MNRFDINAESEKWEHPYRIQVSKPLRKWEVKSIIEDLTAQGISCAVEKRAGMFVVWREPEQEWDVDEASPEWLEEWTSHEPPSWGVFIAEFISETINEGDDKLVNQERRERRNREIYREFKHLKGQGFRLKHIFNLLADKYFLGSQRIRDIVYAERRREGENS